MYICIINNPFQIIKKRYTHCMNKLFSTFLTLSCFVFILILPALLWLHSSMMHDHDMSAWDCIEHCMSWETQAYSSKLTSLSSYFEVLISKTIFAKIFEFTIPLALLYLVLIYAPPNLYKNIKNYSYCSLIGVIKLST